MHVPCYILLPSSKTLAANADKLKDIQIKPNIVEMLALVTKFFIIPLLSD